MLSGTKPYQIILSQSVISKDIPKLPKTMRERAKKAVREKIAAEPTIYGKPLRHNWRGHHRLRIGDYRGIYRIDEPVKTIHIVAIRHRKDIYE